MTAPTKTYSAREIVLAKREAFAEGARHGSTFGNVIDAVEMAKCIYKIPAVQRPRVVSVGDYDFRVIDGKAELRGQHEKTWYPIQFDADDIRILADLLANPTESIPDDDPSSPAVERGGGEA